MDLENTVNAANTRRTVCLPADGRAVTAPSPAAGGAHKRVPRSVHYRKL